MGAGKWIGGIIGFMAGGPLGALAGYALGSLIELGGNTASYTTDYGNGQTEEDVFAGQRNSFLFSMLVMASYIIRADGRQSIIIQYIKKSKDETSSLLLFFISDI